MYLYKLFFIEYIYSLVYYMYVKYFDVEMDSFNVKI